MAVASGPCTQRVPWLSWWFHLLPPCSLLAPSHSLALSGGCALQRLGGLGYCFSASLPPTWPRVPWLRCTEMEAHPELRLKLQANVKAFRDGTPLARSPRRSVVLYYK